MRFILLSLLLAPIASAAPILYRDHGRIVSLSDATSDTNLPKYWAWEGGATTARIVAAGERIEFHAKIDIIGPPWLFIDLVQDANGILIEARDTDDGFDQCWTYRDYDEFLADDSEPVLRDLVTTLFRRLGQRGMLRQSKLPTDDNLAEMRRLVALLDADDWRVRRAARWALRDYVGLVDLLEGDLVHQSSPCRTSFSLQLSSPTADMLLDSRAPIDGVASRAVADSSLCHRALR